MIECELCGLMFKSVSSSSLADVNVALTLLLLRSNLKLWAYVKTTHTRTKTDSNFLSIP